MAHMDCFVDDEAVPLAGGTLDQLFEAAQSHLSDSGRVIVDVVVDGESLSGEQLDQPQQIATADREVRLYTADPRALAVDTLKQVRGRLSEAEQAQQQAAEQLQQDQPSEALQQVSQAIEVWLQTQQAVQHSAALLGLDLDSLTVDQQPASTVIQSLADQLHQLKDALNNGDTVSLADALAYEWPETVQQWDTLVQGMIQRIEGG
jgi:hypothetical protein